MDYNNQPIHILFVCSRNQWRSPTAEALWRNHPNIRTRSAGTSASARHTINQKDVQWADVIMVMESKHKQRVKAMFGEDLADKPIYVLDIPDEYQYMDDELVELLETVVPSLLANKLNTD